MNEYGIVVWVTCPCCTHEDILQEFNPSDAYECVCPSCLTLFDADPLSECAHVLFPSRHPESQNRTVSHDMSS